MHQYEEWVYPSLIFQQFSFSFASLIFIFSSSCCGLCSTRSWWFSLFNFPFFVVTEVHGRTFGVWTLLTCTLCFLCAFNLENKPLYLAIRSCHSSIPLVISWLNTWYIIQWKLRIWLLLASLQLWMLSIKFAIIFL